MQYGEKKAKIRDYYSLKSPSLSGMPGGSGISNPTAKAAELAEKYSEDVELIEKTAEEVGKENALFLLKNVTTKECSVIYLKNRCGMTIGENQFRQMRTQFFYLLAIKKKIV